MQSYTFRPHIIDFTIELKLSSNNTISQASLATYVPYIPIANPTSAFFNAGASFVPSPVTATTFPLSINPTTIAYLSSGRDRLITSNLSIILSKAFAFPIVSTLIGLSNYSAIY